MTKKAEKGTGTQGGNGTDTGLAAALAPLGAGMTATRASLLDWVHGRGVVALQEVFAAEAEGRAGPKGQHQVERTHHHWGTTATELPFGGRRIQVVRPRVRSTEGQEAQLPSVEAWRQRDPLAARILDQILLGVSTRGYAGSLEAAPGGVASRGTSKSAVSRTLRGRVTTALAAQVGQRLEGREWLALFLDGVVIGGQTVIVGLGLTRDGEKVPVGLRLGSTENAVVCTELLQNLLARGLTLTERVLCVIDGGKGLRKAVQDVLGTAAVIQRCQVHKARNLRALVPKARQVYVGAMLRRAYRAGSADAARRQLKPLVTWLEANGHVDAAASRREGIEETLTVLKLALPARLRRLFATTNCIENLIGTVRHLTQRQALAGRRDDSARGKPGARAGGGALPPDQRPWRARHAGDGAAHGNDGRGRGVSCRRISRRSAVTARAQEAQGAILRRGAAMSVSPSEAGFGCSPLALGDRGESN